MLTHCTFFPPMMTSQQFQVLLKISLLSVVFTLIRSFACAQLAITKFPMATRAELVTENVKAQIQKAMFSYIWVIKLIFFWGHGWDKIIIPAISLLLLLLLTLDWLFLCHGFSFSPFICFEPCKCRRYHTCKRNSRTLEMVWEMYSPETFFAKLISGFNLISLI